MIKEAGELNKQFLGKKINCSKADEKCSSSPIIEQQKNIRAQKHNLKNICDRIWKCEESHCWGECRYLDTFTPCWWGEQVAESCWRNPWHIHQIKIHALVAQQYHTLQYGLEYPFLENTFIEYLLHSKFCSRGWRQVMNKEVC